MPKVEILSIDLIRVDADTQVRLATSETTVEDYAELISSCGGEWPLGNLDVFHDGTDYFCSDGFHRLLAARRVGRASVPCHVHVGTAKDARIFGMTANDEHGLRMTREDKRACVEWLLDNYPELSHEDVCAKAGVSRSTVTRFLREKNSKKQIASMTQSDQKTLDFSSENPEIDPKTDDPPFDPSPPPMTKAEAAAAAKREKQARILEAKKKKAAERAAAKRARAAERARKLLEKAKTKEEIRRLKEKQKAQEKAARAADRQAAREAAKEAAKAARLQAREEKRQAKLATLSPAEKTQLTRSLADQLITKSVNAFDDLSTLKKSPDFTHADADRLVKLVNALRGKSVHIVSVKLLQHVGCFIW